MVRDNESVASQLKASQAEIARNNIVVEQIKASQTQAERESQAVTERLNESQKQLALIIATSSEPKMSPEEPKGSPEEPKAVPETPVPRPRPTNLAQTHKPVSAAARPQASKPQSPVWPWSQR